MMNKRNGFPGYRIDERVLITMSALIFISLLILAFRFKNTEPCIDVNIVIKAANYYQGSLISFRAETIGAKTYDWDFSDGVTYESSLPSVQHSFTNPGTYIVSVIVNGHCESFDTVIINEAPVNKTMPLQPEFIAPDTATINKPVTFTDTTSDATSWEWRFGESDIVDDRSKMVSYTYKTSGPKIVYLKINGRSDRVSTRIIYVMEEEPLVKLDKPNIKAKKPADVRRDYRIPDSPREPSFREKPAEGTTLNQPSKPKAYPDVQADEMIVLIQGVVTGEKKATDFNQYFCDEIDIPVTYNGKSMKFSQMCSALRDFKKTSNISRPEVQLAKNSSSACIKMMIVNVNKRSKIDKILGKKK